MTYIMSELANYPHLAAIFTEKDHDHRAWNKDRTLGIWLENPGRVSILDAEGYALHMFPFTIRYAEQLAETGLLPTK